MGQDGDTWPFILIAVDLRAAAVSRAGPGTRLPRSVVTAVYPVVRKVRA
jgi:hypothetical protein